MIFRKGRKTVKKGIGWIDSLVTGIIIGGAAASIYGLSRTQKWKKMTQEIGDQLKGIFRFGMRSFWKVAIRFVSFFQKK